MTLIVYWIAEDISDVGGETLMRTLDWLPVRRFLTFTGLLLLVCSNVHAAERCVDASGKGGCSTTIGAAVAAAAPNDVIRVARGFYHEDVVIGKPLSLLGQSPENTVIDATGLLNGVNVDGFNHPGLAHVIVSGFTVQNANAQGILVTNASDVTISNNQVTGNDKSLNVDTLTCPPLPPYFQAGEAFDCGEGIHLSGVHHSIVSENHVHHNAGGILVSDDTGPNHDNLISANIVEDNPFDCGITIASHHFNLGPPIRRLAFTTSWSWATRPHGMDWSRGRARASAFSPALQAARTTATSS